MIVYHFVVGTQAQPLNKLKVGELFVFVDEFEDLRKSATVYIKVNNCYHREIIKEPKIKDKDNQLVYLVHKK